MKGVLISIQRPHTDNIRALIKTIEVRKGVPKLERPFPVFIYETKSKGGCGKVIGEFNCRGIMDGGSPLLLKQSCLTLEELWNYAKGKRVYGWRIADLKLYDKPKELSDFGNLCRKDCLRLGKGKSCEFLSMDGTPCNRIIPITRPPQSWCYVEVE